MTFFDSDCFCVILFYARTTDVIDFDVIVFEIYMCDLVVVVVGC